MARSSAPPHRGSGRRVERQQSSRVARRAAPRVSARTHRRARRDISLPLTSGPAPSGTPRAAHRRRTTVYWASPGPRTGANSCSRPAGISAFRGQRESGGRRNRVDRLGLNSSRSASRPPESASPGQVGSCIRHRSETRRFTSLRYQGQRRVRSRSPPSPRRSTNKRLHYSPDGKRLAFASTRSGSEEIWIANRDGSNPLQLTSMGGPQCSNPQWSPDGRTILFDSRREGSADLYLLQPDTGKLTRLTRRSGGGGGSPMVA